MNLELTVPGNLTSDGNGGIKIHLKLWQGSALVLERKLGTVLVGAHDTMVLNGRTTTVGARQSSRVTEFVVGIEGQQAGFQNGTSGGNAPKDVTEIRHVLVGEWSGTAIAAK